MKRVELERRAILGALDREANITEAARALGAARRTLQSRMRDYQIPPGEPGRPRELLPRDAAAARGDGVFVALVALGLGGLAWAYWHSREAVGAGRKTDDLRGLDVVLGR